MRELFDEYGKLKPLVAQSDHVLKAIDDVQVRFCCSGGKDDDSLPIIKVSKKVKALHLLGKHVRAFKN